MSKILNTDDLMDVADQIMADDHADIGQGHPVAEAQHAVIEAVDKLADAIAQRYGITKGDTTWEGKEFAGLCSSFGPASAGQECPDPIGAGDPGGDWGEEIEKQ